MVTNNGSFFTNAPEILLLTHYLVIFICHLASERSVALIFLTSFYDCVFRFPLFGHIIIISNASAETGKGTKQGNQIRPRKLLGIPNTTQSAQAGHERVQIIMGHRTRTEGKEPANGFYFHFGHM